MPPSPTVVAGQKVTLVGNLTADSIDTESRTTSAPVPGKTILVCLTGGGVDDRRTVAVDTTDRNGHFTATFVPFATGTYVALLIDADREAISTSNTAVVNVSNR
jgi:hypothetical protein